MKVHELTRDQLVELKQRYLCDWYDSYPFDHNGPSYQELADADTIIPDDLVFDYFDGFDFVPDDFACTAGN